MLALQTACNFCDQHTGQGQFGITGQFFRSMGIYQ
jgi:hypothetical protein